MSTRLFLGQGILVTKSVAVLFLLSGDEYTVYSISVSIRSKLLKAMALYWKLSQ